MPVDLEQELKRTTELRGFRYGLHDFVAQVKGADALRQHNDVIEANTA
jgi:soluble cytochrome b562